MNFSAKFCFVFVFGMMLISSCSEDESHSKTPVEEPNLEVSLSADTVPYRGSFEIYLKSDLRLFDGDHYDVYFDGNLFPFRKTPDSKDDLQEGLVDTLEIGARYTRKPGDFKIVVKAVSYGTDDIEIETDSSNVVTVKPR